MSAQAVRLSNVDIDNALKNKDFEVLFQPIFDLSNGALARVETFIRWKHSSLGVLPPGAFISFFETQGRMGELTRYVLDQALSQYIDWRGPYPPGFSINLALSDLADEAFVSHFKVRLRERNFPAESVTLECPMPPVNVDPATAAAQFERLARTGARLAIEVRGRANDLLRTLSPFPFAEIKTGGAAILRFARTVRGPGLSAISELLELARAQNAAITAVGVEDQASLSALRGLGFSAAQGNHLGKVGLLNQFTPSRVNDVRQLLGLEALSKDDLAAMFRTGAPDLPRLVAEPLTVAAAAIATPAPVDAPAADDLVERLAARIARGESGTARQARKPADPAGQKVDPDRKAAAIARARLRLARARAKPQAQPVDTDIAAAADTASARDMQDRLSREFAAFAEAEGEMAAKAPATRPGDSRQDVEPQLAASDAPTPLVEDSVAAPNEPFAAQLDQSPKFAAAVGAEGAHAAAFAATERPAPFSASSLSVGRASARFIPGVRIMGPAFGASPPLVGTPPVSGGAPAIKEPAPQEPPAAPASTDTPPSDDRLTIPESAAEQVVDEIEPVSTDEAAPVVKTAARRRKKKNFLLRKYRFRMSGYFWPRSIRQLMKRR